MEILNTGFNILLIILGFGLLIFIHELGHFLTAKWAGIRTEAFAVGMGPVMVAWRKGIGARLRSTWPDVVERAREYYQAKGISVDLIGEDEDARRAHVIRAMDALGLGETEYSLRWLPIGGFVKMLGQEDANPKAVSSDPRSYNMRPVGKRMIVVSAGVIANFILAVILFIAAFMIGVRFEAPVVGDVSSLMPAGATMPQRAEALGIEKPGLQPGDRVLQIDGDDVNTFADVQIASAMAAPGESLQFVVQRAGLSEPLRFDLEPEVDTDSGLLSIGIVPASSTTLFNRDVDVVQDRLAAIGLTEQSVEPGMRLIEAGGEPIDTFDALLDHVRNSGGEPVPTTWIHLNEAGEPVGPTVSASVPVQPVFQRFVGHSAVDDSPQAELGLLGFAPLARISEIAKNSKNKGIFRVGDVIVQVEDLAFPRISQIIDRTQLHDESTLKVVVLREGERVELTGRLNRRKKQLGLALTPALEMPISAQPINSQRKQDDDSNDRETIATPIASANLMGGVKILQVGEKPIADWRAFRDALIAHVKAAMPSDEPITIPITIEHPTPGHEHETIEVALTSAEAESLASLGWTTPVLPDLFEPVYESRNAGGNPIVAIKMGFEETHKIMMLTYLTIDRLFRGSVSVKQLHGPVGIVHLGTKIADRGATYLVFFLAMISVNLAVINFLPLPIVDGGLFLFLVYEKLKGRPPSIEFQNWATIVGLCLIGSIFLVTFYNDIMRLVG